MKELDIKTKKSVNGGIAISTMLWIGGIATFVVGGFLKNMINEGMSAKNQNYNNNQNNHDHQSSSTHSGMVRLSPIPWKSTLNLWV